MGELQLDLEIGLDLLGDLDGILQYGVELVVVGLQQQLLGHEADAGVLDAGQLLDGGLNLAAQFAQSTSILNFFCMVAVSFL